MNAKRTVLVIEDDEAIQEMLDFMLESDGYRVVYAYDGLAGLSELNATKPDLIILDIGLPLMDGEAFIAAYRLTPMPHPPIIGISAYKVSPELVSKVDAFLKKPFNFGELRSTVQTVLNRYAGTQS
jgi:DNA-binding response OmpR family regulator